MAIEPERTRKTAEDRRREIADAALRVIATQGLGRFTALAVSREVGLTDGALFRHFPSMEAIVDAAIDRVEELLFEGFPPADEDPIDRLGAFFRRRAAVIRQNPGISPLVISDELAKAGSAQGLERVSGFRRRSAAFVRTSLAEAERRGLLAPGLGTEEAAFVVLGALLALVHGATAPSAAAVVPLAARVWSALESFLRGPSARMQGAGRRPPRRSGRNRNRNGGEAP
jgi:AcrR family transcriptional regulator